MKRIYLLFIVLFIIIFSCNIKKAYIVETPEARNISSEVIVVDGVTFVYFEYKGYKFIFPENSSSPRIVQIFDLTNITK